MEALMLVGTPRGGVQSAQRSDPTVPEMNCGKRHGWGRTLMNRSAAVLSRSTRARIQTAVAGDSRALKVQGFKAPKPLQGILTPILCSGKFHLSSPNSGGLVRLPLRTVAAAAKQDARREALMAAPLFL